MTINIEHVREGDFLAYPRGIYLNMDQHFSVLMFAQVKTVNKENEKVYVLQEDGREGWVRISLFTKHLTKNEEKLYEIDRDRIFVRCMENSACSR